MPHYYKLGNIPHKRHTQFRKPDGGLYSEQLFSTEGFSDDYSLLYHCHPPTQIIKTEPQVDVSPKIAEEKMLKHRSFDGFKIKPEQDFLPYWPMRIPGPACRTHQVRLIKLQDVFSRLGAHNCSR